MSENWLIFGAGVVIAILGWFINDKLKSIKDDTGATREALNAHEKRITRIEKKQEKWEGILIGKGCMDSRDFPCQDESTDPSKPPHVSQLGRVS